MKVAAGGCSCAYGFLCTARSPREATTSPSSRPASSACARPAGDALVDHRLDQQVGDAGGRLAGAEAHEGLLRQRLAGDAQRREDAGHRHRGGALDVVVEAADAVAVLLQQGEGVVVGEVLELHHDAGNTCWWRR